MYVCMHIGDNRLEGLGNHTQLRLLKEGEEQAATWRKLRRYLS